MSGTGLNFLLALGAGAILAYVLRQFAMPITSMARSETNDPTAIRAISYSETVIMYFALVVLLTAFFYLLTSAIVDRRFGI